MHIHHCLESLSDNTGIIYPHKKIHDSKDGFGNCNSLISLSVTEKEIVAAVEKGKKEPQCAIEDLGMKSLLVEKECWDNPPFAGIKRTDNILDEGSDSDDNINAIEIYS